MLTRMFVLLLLLDSGREVKPTTEHVDLIEVNYKHDQGSLGYVQVIAWEWAEDYQRLHCVGWWIADKLGDYPALTIRGDYLAEKNLYGKQVTVRAPHIRLTWTESDPERLNKDLFPEKYRRGLGRYDAIQGLLRNAWKRSD